MIVVASVVLGLAVLAILLPWARHAPIMMTIGITTTVGTIIWNILLNVTNATFLNVGSPVLGRIAQDVGSRVSAFLVTVLALRFVTDRALSRLRGHVRHVLL